MPLTSLYACSFVATLAAREKIRDQVNGTVASQAQLSRASPFLQTQSFASVRVDFNSKPPFNDLLTPGAPVHRTQSASRTYQFADEVKVLKEDSLEAESVRESI